MNLLEKTEQLFSNARFSLIEAAAALYEVRRTDAWKERYETYQEFLTEIDVSQSQASKYCTVIEHYIENGQLSLANISSVEIERLYLAKSLEGTPEEHFEKALVLSRSELKEQKVFEDTGEEHAHEYYCRICHKKSA